jgi:hypothetical protein
LSSQKEQEEFFSSSNFNVASMLLVDVDMGVWVGFLHIQSMALGNHNFYM